MGESVVEKVTEDISPPNKFLLILKALDTL